MTHLRKLSFAFALTLPACGLHGTLPVDIRQLTVREAIEQSSLIAVAKVETIGFAGSRRKTGKGLWIQTWQITINLEYVFKGGETGNLTYLANYYAPGLVQNGDFEHLAVGDRRIFFLRRDGARFRSVSDLYAISVSFPHPVPATRVSGSQPVGEKIATALLTQASGEDAASFAAVIPRVTPGALRAAGYEHTARLLSALVLNGDPSVRAEACLTAYEQVFGSESCLQELDTQAVGESFKSRVAPARRYRAYLRRLSEEALQASRDSPFAAGYTEGVDRNDPESVLEFFDFLSRNPEPVLRASADNELDKLRKARPPGTR